MLPGEIFPWACVGIIIIIIIHSYSHLSAYCRVAESSVGGQVTADMITKYTKPLDPISFPIPANAARSFADLVSRGVPTFGPTFPSCSFWICSCISSRLPPPCRARPSPGTGPRCPSLLSCAGPAWVVAAVVAKNKRGKYLK